MLPDTGLHHRELTGLSMRGIINFFRGFIQHSREQGFSFAVYMVREDLRDCATKHTSFFHDGWTPRGLFLLVPGTRFSMMLEWHEYSHGWSHERSEACFELWCGRFQATFCREREATATVEGSL